MGFWALYKLRNLCKFELTDATGEACGLKGVFTWGGRVRELQQNQVLGLVHITIVV